jgi:hypothetical protein
LNKVTNLQFLRMNDRFPFARDVINQRLMDDSNIIIVRPTVSPKRTLKFADLPKRRGMVFDLMKSTYPSNQSLKVSLTTT